MYKQIQRDKRYGDDRMQPFPFWPRIGRPESCACKNVQMLEKPSSSTRALFIGEVHRPLSLNGLGPVSYVTPTRIAHPLFLVQSFSPHLPTHWHGTACWRLISVTSGQVLFTFRPLDQFGQGQKCHVLQAFRASFDV